eukprot:gene14007-16557_t
MRLQRLLKDKKERQFRFYKVSFDDSGKVENTNCKLYCDAEPVKYPGSTTNMRSHLSSVHKNEYCKMIDTSASVSDESADGDSQNMLDLSVEDKRKVTAAMDDLAKEGILPSIA